MRRHTRLHGSGNKSATDLPDEAAELEPVNYELQYHAPSDHETASLAQSLLGTYPTTVDVDRQGSVQNNSVSSDNENRHVSNTMLSNQYMANPLQSANGPGNIQGMDIGFDWALSAEDLFRLLRTEASTFPLTLPLTDLSPHPAQVGHPVESSEDTVDAGRRAVRLLSTVIKELPLHLVADLEGSDIVSFFFDDCLDLFFTRIVDAFPIVHRPTFIPRESGSTLMLNMLALGSLFIGSKDATTKVCVLPFYVRRSVLTTIKGESFWRLAHAVVATSWQSLMTQRGPRDTCDAVQLVLTAVLGQTYALMSANNALRMTSQVFHGLGFYWARYSGMYDILDLSFQGIPPLDAPLQEKIEKWKVWAALETQKRAILGHYILDGQIAHSSGNATCVRHVANPLTLPATTAAFNATHPDEWVVEMIAHPQSHTTFRSFMLALFQPNDGLIQKPISELSVQVVLECLQSLILEEIEAGGSTLGTPSKTDISSALLRLYRWQILPSDDAAELLIRWHAVFLSLAADTTALCGQISSYCGTEHSLFTSSNRVSRARAVELQTWLSSPDARRAYLHALAIHDTVQRLPFGRTHAVHIPSAIFTSATIHAAFMLGGLRSMVVPSTVDWNQLWSSEDAHFVDGTIDDGSFSETHQFLNGSLYHIKTRFHSRKISAGIHALIMQLKAVSPHWGIAQQMEPILRHWMNALKPTR